MSPSTVDSTDVRLMPRAAAMLAMPAVRQAASACSRNSTGVGPLSVPTSTAGWSASKVNGCLWVISWVAPKKPWNVERLWVPLTHLLVARNWKSAISWFALTALMVAKRVAVSTPLRIGLSVTVMAVVSLPGRSGRPAGRSTVRRRPWGWHRCVHASSDRSRRAGGGVCVVADGAQRGVGTASRAPRDAGGAASGRPAGRRRRRRAPPPVPPRAAPGRAGRRGRRSPWRTPSSGRRTG